MTLEQEKKLDEVHQAIVGNDAIGHRGIVNRLIEIEVEIEKNKRIKSKVIGAGAVCSFAGSALITWLIKHF